MSPWPLFVPAQPGPVHEARDWTLLDTDEATWSGAHVTAGGVILP